MSQSHEYRKQTSNVAPPTEAGVVKVYANSSGALLFVDSNSTTGYASAYFAQNISQVNGTLPATGVNPTGAYYGNTGAAINRPVYLAAPDQWLVVSAPSGGKYVVPAYLYT
jgi:hypothetical protein